MLLTLILVIMIFLFQGSLLPKYLENKETVGRSFRLRPRGGQTPYTSPYSNIYIKINIFLFY